MKNLISLTVFLISALTSNALALTPEESLRSIVNELKSTRKVSSLVKHVDWDFAYNKLSESEKKQTGFSSSSSMRSYYSSRMESNGSDIVDTIKKETVEQSEAGNKYDPTNLNKVNEYYEQLKIEHDKDITAMSFDIGVANIAADKQSAMVFIKRELKGETVSKRVRLVKSGDSWLLSSAEIFNPIKAVYSSPVGGILRPIMAIHNL